MKQCTKAIQSKDTNINKNLTLAMAMCLGKQKILFLSRIWRNLQSNTFLVGMATFGKYSDNVHYNFISQK